jgi:adenylate cyclase
VAYGSQLGERRARIHERVARAIEERFPEKLDEQAALIASHWDHAGKAREAAEWHRRAAIWVRLNNAPESLRYWSRVRELLGRVPESPETIALGLEASSSMLFDSVRMGVSHEDLSDLLAEGRGLASRCADPQAVVTFLALASGSMWALGRLDESCALAEEARAHSDQIGEGPAPIYSRGVQAMTYRTLGRLDEALAAADEAIELAREATHGAGADVVWAPALPLLVKAWALTQMGRLREASRVLEQGIEHALAGDDLAMTVLGHQVGVELTVTIGDNEAALPHGSRAVEASEKMGSRAAHSLSYQALGRAHVAGGRWEDALAALDEALSVPREYGTALWTEPEILSQMALAHAGLGGAARARELADQAVPLARELLTKPGECEAELVRARVLIRFDPSKARDDIAAALDAAAGLAKEMNAKSFEPFICEERARLARVSGDPAAFERELREAQRLYTEMGATGHAERLARELGP